MNTESIRHVLPLCVMVTVNGPALIDQPHIDQTLFQTENGRTTLGCSGFVIDPDQYLVLSTANILIPFLAKQQGPNSSSSSSISRHNPDLKIQVWFFDSSDSETGSTADIYLREAKLMDLFQVKQITPKLVDMLKGTSDWFLGFKSHSISTQASLTTTPASKNGHNDSSSASLLPRVLPNSNDYFALFKFHSDAKSDALKKEKQFFHHLRLSRPRFASPKWGEQVSVIGTPFGLISPPLFGNSVSSGLVSNTIPTDRTGSLLLIDARVLPGNEGSPIFNSHGEIIGIVLVPLRNVSYTIALNLGMSMEPILGHMRRQYDFSHPRASSDSAFEQLRSSLVLIDVGDKTWSSGLLISDEYVLLNEHSIRSMDPKSREGSISDIVVEFHHTGKHSTRPQQRRLAARVVFSSDGPLDIAILKIPKVKDVPPIRISDKMPDVSVGMPVYVCGFPLFSPETKIQSTICEGCVSKVICSTLNQVVQIQTTAAVHKGISGGFLANSKGELLGLVISNAKLYGHVIPHLNLSIPISLISVPLKRFLETQDVTVLHQAFNTPNEELECVWSMRSVQLSGFTSDTSSPSYVESAAVLPTSKL